MRYLFLFSLATLIGCYPEDGDRGVSYVVYYSNTTNHTIEFRPYGGGIHLQNYNVVLLPGESEKITSGVIMGTPSLGYSLISENLASTDSVVIKFDNSRSTTHYFSNPVDTASSYYPLTSPRNIYNRESYFAEYVGGVSTRHMYTYKFVEQDYLDAE